MEWAWRAENIKLKDFAATSHEEEIMKITLQ
jgi:hypothetical protein